MSRAERLLELLQALRRHRRPVTAQRLAEELQVSARSVYRDVATLQAQGADIRGEAGVGYVLKPGYMLPPLMFSEEEIEALVLGSRWVAEHGDAALAAAGRDSLAKLLAVLPQELRQGAEDIALLVPPAREAAAGERELPTIRQAIRRERKLMIRYADADGAATARIIWPFALGFFEHVRMIAAWCELRQGFRHFRADRITAIEPRDERYPRRRALLLAEWRATEGITA
jgi:predicted DNA-binding transcriptional regulator YafY